MNIYVASSFKKNYRNARALMQMIRDKDHIITYDWTATDEFDEAGNLAFEPVKLPHTKQIWFAMQDIRGVVKADLFVLLWHPDMAGAYIEMGYMISSPKLKPIHVIGAERFTIFWALPQVTMHDTIEDFLAWLDDAGST